MKNEEIKQKYNQFLINLIQNKQCEECTLSYTDYNWKSVVQVRQRVKHKKTFLRLEQVQKETLIIKFKKFIVKKNSINLNFL